MYEIKELDGRGYAIFLPREAAAKTPWPLILLNGDASMLELLERERLLPLKRCLGVMPLSKNRLDDFTPWPERALSSRFPDFGGKADEYLSWIWGVLLPSIQGEYPVSNSPAETGMLGQSLGGLLTLYIQTGRPGTRFGYAAAISPSCWYPGFLPYMKDHLPEYSDTRWYISCGTEEGKGHPDIKQNSVQQSRCMMEFLTKRYGNAHVTTQWDQGGHHDHLPLRYGRALSWLELELQPGRAL